VVQEDPGVTYVLEDGTVVYPDGTIVPGNLGTHTRTRHGT
jgi:hypothetical protein